MTYVWLEMGNVPEEWKDKARTLCLPPGRLDPAGGTMYRWSFHDGSTWACFVFPGTELNPSSMLGWACITLQEEPEPVIGVYVDSYHRGKGIASQLISVLLTASHKIVEQGSEIIAVQDRYPKYKELIEKAGYVQKNWE